jgi:large subunit ribosomal protein L27
MAHKKATASSAGQGGNVSGKRLGIKKYGGESVKKGMIIVKQMGSKIYPGKNAYASRTFTIHAKEAGIVSFRKGSGNRRGSKVVDVLPFEETK